MEVYRGLPLLDFSKAGQGVPQCDLLCLIWKINLILQLVASLQQNVKCKNHLLLLQVKPVSSKSQTQAHRLFPWMKFTSTFPFSLLQHCGCDSPEIPSLYTRETMDSGHGAFYRRRKHHKINENDKSNRILVQEGDHLHR